jgi:hypothetical protein
MWENGYEWQKYSRGSGILSSAIGSRVPKGLSGQKERSCGFSIRQENQTKGPMLVQFLDLRKYCLL